MVQLYRLPNGRVVSLYDHPTFAVVKLCPRCNRMVTKWHEHLTKPKEAITATSLWVRPPAQGASPSAPPPAASSPRPP